MIPNGKPRVLPFPRPAWAPMPWSFTLRTFAVAAVSGFISWALDRYVNLYAALGFCTGQMFCFAISLWIDQRRTRELMKFEERILETMRHLEGRNE